MASSLLHSQRVTADVAGGGGGGGGGDIRSPFATLWEAARRTERDANSVREEHDEDDEEDEAEEEEEEEEENDTARSDEDAPLRAAKRRGPSGSPPSTAAVSATRPAKRVRRRRSRKPTYLLQKEERELLAEEIRILEARAELLRMRSGLPTDQDKRSLTHLQTVNDELEDKIHTNLMHLGRCQMLISNEINATPVNPMRAYIHMPRNLRARRQLLRVIKDKRLLRAEQLVTQRLQYIDPFKPYVNEERFVDDAGLYQCKRFEVIPFRGLDSARPVFDALLYFLSNIEISYTETMGHLTIREDADDFDPSIWNHRVISRNTGGFTEEMNVTGFAIYRDNVETLAGGAARGVVACDSVDEDDLHPYVPTERVRKDITASYTINEYRRPETRELVVVLKRCVFLALHPPQFELPESTIESIHEHMTAWAPMMARLIRDKVYTVVR